MDISKHYLLKLSYEVSQLIEECGASPELTKAVTKSCELGEAINNFLKQIDHI